MKIKLIKDNKETIIDTDTDWLDKVVYDVLLKTMIADVYRDELPKEQIECDEIIFDDGTLAEHDFGKLKMRDLWLIRYDVGVLDADNKVEKITHHDEHISAFDVDENGNESIISCYEVEFY